MNNYAPWVTYKWPCQVQKKKHPQNFCQSFLVCSSFELPLWEERETRAKADCRYANMNLVAQVNEHKSQVSQVDVLVYFSWFLNDHLPLRQTRRGNRTTLKSPMHKVWFTWGWLWRWGGPREGLSGVFCAFEALEKGPLMLLKWHSR